VKTLVCIVVLSAALAAIKAFAKGAGVELTSQQGKRFVERTDKVSAIISERLAAKPALKIPFSIQQSSWGQKQMNKRRRLERRRGPRLTGPP
jgi:hypothetical protein